jgi:MoaA/NifB/PqqE/SkfB family radical SAM enzyme
MAGYPKIQTVTNGRMFSYPEFLHRCVDAGLSEITFSINGTNAKIHDALVGT